MNDKISIYKEFLERDPRGFNIIFITHREPLIKYGLELLLKRDIVEDAVSDAFILLLEKIDIFNDEEHIQRFLYSVVWRKCQTARREIRRTITSKEQTENMPDPEAVQPLELMELTVYTQWLMQKILTQLQELPKRRRQDFHAHFFESKSFEEIAQKRGVSADAVARNVQLAQKELQKTLKINGLSISYTFLLSFLLWIF